MKMDKVITTKDVMKTSFVELDRMMTVKDALHSMEVEGVSVVMVKKRDEHDAYGILLLADIAKLVLAKDKAPERVNIYEIMSKPVISVPPELDVRHCARLFDRFGLAVAPVVEHGNVIGIVSYRELVLKGLLGMYSSS